MTALLVQSLNARLITIWVKTGRRLINTPSPIEPGVYEDTFTAFTWWEDDPEPCMTCLTHWGNPSSGGLGGAGGGGGLAPICRPQASEYEYVVFAEYTRTPETDNSTTYNSMRTGYNPNSSIGVRVSIPASGTYLIKLTLTSKNCHECCDSPEKGKLLFEITMRTYLNLQSDGLSRFIPIHLNQYITHKDCLTDEKC